MLILEIREQTTNNLIKLKCSCGEVFWRLSLVRFVVCPKCGFRQDMLELLNPGKEEENSKKEASAS